MNLRRDVKFHNGKPFSTDDVTSTSNHVSGPDSGVITRRNVSWVKNVEKLSPYKVRSHLQRPFPAALEFLSGPMAIMPAGIWETAKEDAPGKPDYGTVAPIGTGPYRITKVVTGETIEMTVNKNYFDGPQGKPSIGQVVFRTISDPETQIAELLTGSLNWMWDVTKDKAEELVGAASSVIHSACYPSQLGCTQDVPQYEYDPKKARQLLAEAGYPNDFTTDIYAYRQR